MYWTVNFGSAGELQVQSNADINLVRDAYLRFDLASVASVSSAKFRVYAALSESGSASATLYPVTGSWSESSLIWNTRPGYISSNPLGVLAPGTASFSTFEIDVTNYVKSERQAGRTLVSFALHSPAPSVPRIVTKSREASGNRPELIVTP